MITLSRFESLIFFHQYAKDEDNVDGLSVRITAYNRGPDPADLHIIPQLFFRNTWSWPKERPTGKAMPSLRATSDNTIQVEHETLGTFYFHAKNAPAPRVPSHPFRKGSKASQTDHEGPEVEPQLMFTDNDTNYERLYGVKNAVPYVKDAFHDHIIPSHRPQVSPSPKADGDEACDSDSTTPRAGSPSSFINPDRIGTKAGACYVFKSVPPNGGSAVVHLKLTSDPSDPATSDDLIDSTLHERRLDSDEFYARFNTGGLNSDQFNILRQALSGMLWTKQFYYFVQKEWIEGDPGQMPPPPERQFVRNRVSQASSLSLSSGILTIAGQQWRHLHIDNILSMPDKWE
jgi:hypothetical protein